MLILHEPKVRINPTITKTIQCSFAIFPSYLSLTPITFFPKYFCSTAGTFMLPSFCWYTSTIALNALPVAIAVLFSVWMYSFSCPSFPFLYSLLYLILSLAAWYAVQLLQLTTSLYICSRGIHASMSYFFAATIPMSPVHILTTRYGSFSFWNKVSAFFRSSSWNFHESFGSQKINCSILLK